jgi:T6SS, Phospholipase effector Tle1-like, catalytic domain
MALYAFDGTWNTEKDAGRYDLNTNVVRFKDLYAGPKFFYKGLGTRHGAIGKFFGGAFGVGGHNRIEAAKTDMARQFAAGDRDIDIVGFSRGAALAVHFANVIGDSGITVNGVRENPQVRFLGVFDVVAAFGIPIDIGLSFNRINLGYKLGLSKAVKHCYHALALDESRKAFRPTRVREGCEVWFRGVHSDVGGGNNNHALNDITLRWMLRKAIATGLPMVTDCVGTSCTRINLDGTIGEIFDKILSRAREPQADDRFHYTVAMRAKHVNPPDPCTRETELGESQL